jgi:NADPH:quinone reductase-like Zn-dependent oxidoreductase
MPMMPTMRAVVLTGYGGVERLEPREVRRPVPGSGQLLVRVRAAGVNPIDWKIRQGRLRLLLPARFPLVLGFDVAGAYDFGACEPALVPGGIYVTTRPGPAIFIAQLRAALSRLIDRHGARRAAVLRTRPRGDDLAALADLVAEGRLRPAIDRVYSLDEVREAHTASQAGHLMGKIVLRC